MEHPLYRPFRIRGVSIRNRLGLAPMSQYMAPDGTPNEWHFRHYADRSSAVGMTIVEATAVEPVARVTPYDLVLDVDSNLAPWRRLSSEIRAAGAVPCLQLSHAGRKASRTRPWEGDHPLPATEGGWDPVGPTGEPFAHDQLHPRELRDADIPIVVDRFVTSARLALETGFGAIELHAGHGRLFHEFYSPRSNRRAGHFGESFSGRTRLLMDTVSQVRAEIGEAIPLIVRLSCSDWIPDGWSIEDSTQLATALVGAGADMIDCTSGGIEKGVRIPRGPGYQIPFAHRIRQVPGMMSAAVGEIRTLRQAESVIDEGRADMILMGRKLLTDPFYVGRKLRTSAFLPAPYQRALPRESAALVQAGTPEL